jgi:hypothetical protein
MALEHYIVEGSNWKCKVSLEKSKEVDAEYRLIEAATRCVEHLFTNTMRDDSVDVLELKDSNGVDFFSMMGGPVDDVPDPAFGLLIKIYKAKDTNKVDNHYVIRTKVLMENASAYEAIHLSFELENEIKKRNPRMYKTIHSLMKNKLILKLGEIKKISEDL